MPRLLSPLLAALLLAAAVAATAHALPRANPADRLLDHPIEEPVYDRATRCTKKRRPGVDAFVNWLTANVRGQNWGSYRCEMWGKRQASLHAEGRAVDWHLDASNRADNREAQRLIALLLAPDAAGNEHALARRMGVQEIIWDCAYWSAGMSELSEYRACLTKRGKPNRKVSATIAHRDHVHFGLTKAGAMARTSFWSAK